MTSTRLIAISESEVERVGELVERIIARRDNSVNSELREALANDANLLASLADRWASGIDDDEATVGADLLDVYQQSFDAPLRMIALGLVSKLRAAFQTKEER